MWPRFAIVLLMSGLAFAQVNVELEPDELPPDSPPAKPKPAPTPPAARPAKPATPKVEDRLAPQPRIEQPDEPDQLIPAKPATPTPKPKPKAKKPDAAKAGPPTRPAAPKPQGDPTPETRSWLLKAKNSIVASDSSEASQIGLNVLKAGGNAIDAAVATSFALGVTRPYHCGLGGGGFVVIYLAARKETLAFDFRETAPGDATWDMFVEARKKDPNGLVPSRFGGLAVGVPGLLAGASYLLSEFGTMRLDRVINPSIELAQMGFKADADYVTVCRNAAAAYARNHEMLTRFPDLYQQVLNNGNPIKVGQLVQRLDLASGLQLIATGGTQAFYEGQIADAIVRSVEKAGGVLKHEDLLSYRVRERKPIRFNYRKFEIITMPPPSSGGVVIAETLNILSNYRLGEIHSRQPEQAAHLFVEACKHAFADRSRWVGDPAFVNVPVSGLTGQKYAASLAKQIDEKKPKPTKEYGSTRVPDDSGTTHFCVVDADDNVVSWTETINLPFGSYVVAEPFGIILNNEMDDFCAEPGKPDAFGLRTGTANAVAPGKRPLSSMSPTIVLDSAGRPVLAVGAAGGPKIISSVLSMLVNTIDYDMTLGQAMEAVRLHHQWMPDELVFSDQPESAFFEDLRKRGHLMARQYGSGIAQSVEWDNDGTLLGACEPRKGHRPAGE